MSAMFVLMGLLFFSYLGTFLARGRKRLGTGLPSSSEYLLIGAVAGPLLLDVVTRDTLATFDPLAYVAIGWLALASGLGWGHVGARRISWRRIALGIALTSACGALVTLVVWVAAPHVAPLAASDRLLLAGGMGCVCAESTRHAILWTVRRHGARGPTTDLLRDLSHSDEIVPIAATTLLFALQPRVHGLVQLPWFGWAAITVMMGIVLGALTSMLLARDHRVAESWGTLLGASLMTIGLAARLDLAAVAALFVLGASIAWLSRHGSDVEAMVLTTERAVMLPALLLAGARLHPASIGRFGVLIAVAIGVRFAVKWLSGTLLRAHPTVRATRAVGGGGHLLGVALASSGGVSILIGLAMAMRFPGALGNTILATAVSATVLGEPTGPLVHRLLLDRAGEVPPPTPDPIDATEASEMPEGNDAIHGDIDGEHSAATARTDAAPHVPAKATS